MVFSVQEKSNIVLQKILALFGQVNVNYRARSALVKLFKPNKPSVLQET